MTLSDLLERKNLGIVSTKASTTALEAVDVMCNKKVGSLLVESDDGKLIGILTERDILRFCAERRGGLESTLVSDIMCTDILVASPETSVDEAMSIMTEHRFRHLPIIEGGRPTGVISIGDLVKAQLKDVTVEVKYLRDFISA